MTALKLLISVCILGATTVGAQVVSPVVSGSGPQPMVRQMRPPAPAMTGERAEVDLQLVNGMPSFAVMVNGRGPYRFGLDTGASGYLRVTPTLATTLGLQQIGEARSSDPSGLNPVRIPIYQADSVAFGNLTYTGVSVSAMGQISPRLAGLDGIIGIGFFERLLLEIDYGRLRLVARKGGLPPANGRDVVEISYDRGGLISVPLTIGTTSHPVHLDTGNTRYPLFMPASSIAALPTRGTARDIGVARTVSQTVALQAIGLAAPVRVGTTRLGVTDVGFPAIASVGNIGSLALTGMLVTIDYPNRRLRIVPSRK